MIPVNDPSHLYLKKREPYNWLLSWHMRSVCSFFHTVRNRRRLIRILPRDSLDELSWFHPWVDVTTLRLYEPHGNMHLSRLVDRLKGWEDWKGPHQVRRASDPMRMTDVQCVSDDYWNQWMRHEQSMTVHTYRSVSVRFLRQSSSSCSPVFHAIVLNNNHSRWSRWNQCIFLPVVDINGRPNGCDVTGVNNPGDSP